MPVYDYDCAACGRRFEVIHGVHADGPTACELCGKGPVRKAVTAAAVHYRGSGWAKKERRSAASGKTPAESTSETSGSDGTNVESPAAKEKSDGGSDAPTTKTDAPAKKTDAPAAGTNGPKKGSADTSVRTSSTRTD